MGYIQLLSCLPSCCYRSGQSVIANNLEYSADITIAMVALIYVEHPQQGVCPVTTNRMLCMYTTIIV